MKKIIAALSFLVSTTSLAAEEVPTFINKQMTCLKQNVYFEARNQSIKGQKAVIYVTMNRVLSDRYPDNICDVVFQRKQFSWTHDGQPDYPSDNVVEQKAWNDISGIVMIALLEMLIGKPDPTHGATHYHNTSVNPNWASKDHLLTQIGSHLFYRL